MVNFTYYAPTKVAFGRDAELQTGDLVAAQGCKKVLLHYGGESAQKSGLLGRIRTALADAGVAYVELGGVVPNPLLSLVREGVALCKAQGVDFILAVGGGSVIDSAKAIAYGAAADTDVWDFYLGAAKPRAALPVGAVVTIAAAGSEMSNSSVITDEASGYKRGFRNDLCRCTFAVMNPALTFTLPPEQTAAGCADILLHTLERYFTPESTMELTDGIAEALMRTVMDNARILTREPDNYDARAEVMWAGSLSHNDLTGCGGGGGDWACHQLSHVLSARYGMTHGAALTAVWGSWARYVYKEDIPRFARFAEQVMGLPGQDDEKALAKAGIEELEGFFWSLDLPVSIGEAGFEVSDQDAEEMAHMCTYEGKRTIGAFRVLDEKDIAEIFRMAR